MINSEKHQRCSAFHSVKYSRFNSFCKNTSLLTEAKLFCPLIYDSIICEQQCFTINLFVVYSEKMCGQHACLHTHTHTLIHISRLAWKFLRKEGVAIPALQKWLSISYGLAYWLSFTLIRCTPIPETKKENNWSHSSNITSFSNWRADVRRDSWEPATVTSSAVTNTLTKSSFEKKWFLGLKSRLHTIIVGKSWKKSEVSHP